jgi:hypothetical protein
VITYIVDTSVEGTKLCLRFVADFTTAPLAINDTGASGSVAIEHAAADGACDSSSVFEGSQVDSADFSIAFNGTSAIGTLTIPGDPPIALQFKADRAGSNPSTTSNEPIAGIGEFVDGVALTEETRKRIEELEACTDEDLQVGGRCDNESALTPFKALAELRFGQGALADDVELQRAAVLATLRDPSGKLLCPSIGPMFPVLMALRARSVIDESANIALNRLVGLLVAMDLDARK